MARALLGYVSTGTDQILVAEVARLRRRITELEREVAELRDHKQVDLDLELHDIAQAAEPVLT
jgi:cell division protein FtsB